MAQPSGIVKMLAPRVPGMLKTAIWHSLSLSETSDKWDLRTALTITTLRSILQSSTSSITKQQAFSLKDPGVKGHMWISRVALPIPEEDDLRQLLFKAIDDLNVDKGTYTKPESHEVTAEWAGFRSAGGKETSEPVELSEENKYKSLMDEVKTDVTVLYFHGGAYYLMDPATHRQTTSKLAKKTKGRVFSVRYRLAPQHPFPAALLDALYAYLYLLYPPPGAFHRPVKPEHIVFAGDSAGGNLSLVLLQFLLHTHRTSPNSPPTVMCNGQRVSLPLPAGCATISPWCDILHSLPSVARNAKYDYLPIPYVSTTKTDLQTSEGKSPITSPYKKRSFPQCDVWPAKPPRAHLYCDGGMPCHPLVSPVACKAEQWRGSPPLFFCQGEESLADESRLIARRAAQQGVPVRFEAFEGMPHCFILLLEGSEMVRRCYKNWAEAIRQFVESPNSQARQTSAVTCRAFGKADIELDMSGHDFVALGDDESWSIMRATMQRKEREFQAEQRDAVPRL